MGRARDVPDALVLVDVAPAPFLIAADIEYLRPTAEGTPHIL